MKLAVPKLWSARPPTLDACWKLLARMDKSEAERVRHERGLLTDDQLFEYDLQCKLLEESGEEALSVAEYLSCKLEDALEKLSVGFGVDQ